jgi:phosphoglycolate phosphatase
MRFGRVRSVVFDLDGTLIDSVPDVWASVNDMLEKFGRSPLPRERVQRLVGGGARRLVERAFLETGPRPSAADTERGVDAFLSAYRTHPTRHTRIYPGVVETLTRLKRADFRLGICTNKPKVMADLVLSRLGLDVCLDGVSCGDQLPYQKPDGRHVAHAMKLIDADTGTTVLVGDSRVDLDAATAAGIPMIAVAYGYEERSRLDGAAAMVETFPEIEAYLNP